MDVEQVDYKLSLDETNVLKGIAICAMLVHHLFFDHPEFGDVVSQLAGLGKVCVSIFLFLSGYGLSIQFDKAFAKAGDNIVVKTIIFLANRFFKFYLNYWVVFFISILFGVLLFGKPLNNFVQDFFAFGGYGSYNATWWFNRLILSFYVLFPIVFILTRNKWVGLVFLVGLFFFSTDALRFLRALDGNIPQYAFVFVMGAFVANNIGVINKILNKVKVEYVLLASIFALICFYNLSHIYITPMLYGSNAHPFITLFLALTIVCVCRISNRQMKPLAYLGRHSMNMYLVHTFICGYFFSDFIYGFKYPILIFAALLGTSLLFSVVLEFAKSKLGFYKFQNWVVQKLSVR